MSVQHCAQQRVFARAMICVFILHAASLQYCTASGRTPSAWKKHFSIRHRQDRQSHCQVFRPRSDCARIASGCARCIHTACARLRKTAPSAQTDAYVRNLNGALTFNCAISTKAIQQWPSVKSPNACIQQRATKLKLLQIKNTVSAI